MKQPGSIEGTYDRPYPIQPESDAARRLKGLNGTGGRLGSYNMREGTIVPNVYSDHFAELRGDKPKQHPMIEALLRHIDRDSAQQ